MSPHVHRQVIPRGVLWAAGAMMLFSIGFAAAARRVNLAAPRDGRPPIQSVELRFADRPDGGIAVLDAAGREVRRFAPGGDGFVRGVMRGMFRTRKLESLGRDGRFRLAREADGRLTLTDPETGRKVDLDAFGPTNAMVFDGLLAAGRGAAPAAQEVTP